MSEIGGISGMKGQWMFPLQSERSSAIGTGDVKGPQGGMPKVGPAAESSGSFLETLKGALSEVNEVQTHADTAMRDFSAGKNASLHDVMIAMEKADVSLRTAASIRNKMVEAYNEIMRMQV